ncbi:MAG: N-acetylmuramoyl-L-alanine amidase [Leptospira sp.]|nr:N-acetylmuramoyl-L-alanine amidase [Leptospira sp.]NCS95178.1 N-acetylmuramoyl-L-alanine amidase [Leptospira sp.]
MYSESVKLPLRGKYSYLALDEIQKIFPELTINSNDPIQITSIKGNSKEIRIRTGSSFYVLDGTINKIQLKILSSRGKTYIPPDLVEAILMNLIEYEVFYQFADTQLVLEVRTKDAGKSFLPVKAVVIDAGHGGKDPGTSSKKGKHEKDIALAVANQLYAAIRKTYPEMVVYRIRSNDSFVPLDERSQLANKLLIDVKEAIFISLHCNASLSEKPSGYEIYYLSQTPTTEQARETAILENKILNSNYGQPVANIQAGMMSSLVQRRSRKLASTLDSHLNKGIGRLIPARGIKKADFSVLRGSLMPAVLIEMGYLSHPKESVFLESKKVQSRLVKSILQGIKDYGDGKD